MNILLFGPQGSGKGTQARLLSEKFGLFYFESGAYLRKIAEKNQNLKDLMNQGKLVPDKEMTSYVTAYLDEENLYNDVVFDGFPRTSSQYHFLKNWLHDKEFIINLVLVIEISDAESIKRLSSRREDPDSGKIYNLLTDLPPKDIDQSTLVQRGDDTPDGIKKRLQIYRARTEPLIEELKMGLPVFEINGENTVDAIHKEIVSIIHKIIKND